jgi:hypothetical protein
MKMMTDEDIQSEFGWNDKMIYSLLQAPDSSHARRNKHTGGYTYGLYHRERVLAAAQSKEGRDAKRRWDETLRSFIPNPGWTTRLGDIGQPLGITAFATGRILELLGYRSNKHVTDSAVAAGYGVRRWDGYTMHDDWHLEPLMSAIRSAAQSPGETAVADALAAAIANQQRRELVLPRKRKQEETAATCPQEEEAVISGIEVDIRVLRVTDPGMSLLDAVEYVTSDPDRRIALFRRCSAEDQSVNGMAQDDPRLLKIASLVAKDLALLERRARAEGCQVQEE